MLQSHYLQDYIYFPKFTQWKFRKIFKYFYLLHHWSCMKLLVSSLPVCVLLSPGIALLAVIQRAKSSSLIHDPHIWCLNSSVLNGNNTEYCKGADDVSAMGEFYRQTLWVSIQFNAEYWDENISFLSGIWSLQIHFTCIEMVDEWRCDLNSILACAEKGEANVSSQYSLAGRQ